VKAVIGTHEEGKKSDADYRNAMVVHHVANSTTYRKRSGS